MRKYYIFIGIMTVVVGLIVLESFRIGGSPVASNNRNKDNKILLDFSLIKNAVDTYFVNNRILPDNLEILGEINGLSNEISAYTYEKNTDTSFRLCATFSTDTRLIEEDYMYPNPLQIKHPAGYYCAPLSVHDPTGGKSLNNREYIQYTDTPTITNGTNYTPPLNNDTFFTHECPGELVNGVCQTQSCSYVYPVSLYSKGFASASGVLFEDICSDSQVFKHACQTINNGRTYDHTVQNFYCPNGCNNGACIR